MKSTFTNLTLSGLLFLFAGSFANFGVAAQGGGSLSEKEALRIVRAVNTIEASFFMSKQGYVTMDEMLRDSPGPDGVSKQSNIETPAGAPVNRIDSSSASVNGNKLSVITSPDRKHYSVNISPVAGGCSQVFFSNESGIIYLAKAIGCSD